MLGLAVVLALALGCTSPTPPPPVANATPTQPAIDDHDLLVTMVLQRFLGKPDTLADNGLLPATGPLYIAAEIGDPPRSRVHVASLPAGRFAIRSLAELQAEADRTGTNLAFIRFFKLDLEDRTHARIQVGVDILLPKQSQAIKTCCCSAISHWEKHDGTWSATPARVTICG